MPPEEFYAKRINRFSFLLIIIFVLVLDSFELSKAETNSYLITNLEEKINNAFQTLLNAEKEGAIMTVLVEKLNTAIMIYEEIKLTVNEGNNETVLESVLECENIISQVNDEANTIRIASVEQQRILTERKNLFIRATIIVVTLTSFVLWSKFKKYYSKRILLMKPVVNEDES